MNARVSVEWLYGKRIRDVCVADDEATPKNC